MKKIISALTLAMAFAGSALAQDDLGTANLVVHTGDGQSVEYSFAVEPVVTFEGNDLVLTDIDETRVVYPMSEGVSFTFTNITTGISNTKVTPSLSVRLVNGIVTVAGLEPNAPVMVYDLAGRRVATAAADPTGSAVVNTQGWSAGAYVFSAKGQSFKIIK
ncbi:MAG: hypothetical protein K2K26_08615 [Muribaculaceae bacterium]|nr:hypothetical protein [Muribaculaceae bacterium]